MPGLDVFPFDIWSRLEARRWRHSQELLGYGDPAGYQGLRELLAVYLKASRGVVCTPEQIIITSGSQQALFLVSNMLLDPGDTAWMESPGYRGASAPLQAAQVRLCPVPVDEHGLSVEAGIGLCPNARLAYVTPSHQLPLGVTMSLQRRLELLSWAAKQGAWIIEDDYDSEYRYSGPTLASLQSLDRSSCVIYVGSLSKVLFPGLRLGYMVVPPALVAPLVLAKSVIDKCTAIVPQMVLTDFIAEGHFNRHIRRTREVYGERREVLLRALENHLPEQLQCGASDGGLDLAVYFNKNWDEEAVARAGLQQGIELRPLSHYVQQRGDALADNVGSPCRDSLLPISLPRAGLLLGFSSIPVDDIRAGIKSLANILRSLPQR